MARRNGVADLDELGRLMADLARTLHGEHDSVEDTLQAINRAALAGIPGVEHAAIILVKRRREVETRASIGEVPQLVDTLQQETGEGPCLRNIAEQLTATVGTPAVTRPPSAMY